MNWCEKHDHFKRTCPWCEIEMLEAQLDQALEALEELKHADGEEVIHIIRQAIQQIKGDAM